MMPVFLRILRKIQARGAKDICLCGHVYRHHKEHPHWKKKFIQRYHGCDNYRNAHEWAVYQQAMKGE